MPHSRLWVLALLAQALSGQQYPFLAVPNSPRNIERLIQDQQGRLWLSTHDNVWCFDGTRFFSLREFGFPSELSYGLALDFAGAILSGTDSGVYRLFQGRLEHILSGPKMMEITAVGPGLLLGTGYTVASPSGENLYRMRQASGRWTWDQLSDWKSNGTLSRDQAGNVLMGCPGGWCELSAKLIAEWHPGDTRGPVRHASSMPDVRRVVRDRRGCLWFRTTETGAYQCPGDATPIRLPPTIAGRNVWSALAENEDGSLLFANVSSVSVGRPDAFQSVTPEHGLPPVAVSSAVQGRDGTIWIGSIDGLYRFAYPFRLELWKSRQGLVWSFARSGDRLLAGSTAGVAYLDQDRQWRALKGTQELGSISSLALDGNGNLYGVVAQDAVILLAANGRLLARTRAEEGRGAEMLVRTRDGEVWVAGAGIRKVRREGNVLALDSETGPGGGSSGRLSMTEAPTATLAPGGRPGELWVCRPDELWHRAQGMWFAFRPSRAIPNMGCAAMAEEPGGDLWLAYPTLRQLSLAHPTADERIAVRSFVDKASSGPFFVGIDARGWLWRGAGDATFAGRLDQARNGIWVKLNDVDGLANLDANRRSFFSDTDGSVWWAADTSIVHFSPPPDLTEAKDFLPAFLSGFSVDGGPTRLAEAQPDFPQGKRILAEAGSLWFKQRNSLQIRYRMLPEQQEWRDATSLEMDLGSLGWGGHSLEMESRLNVGEWSVPSRREIVVRRPWWLSWETASGVCGGLAALAAGVLVWRRRPSGLPDLTDWRVAALAPEMQWIGTTLDQRYEVVSLIALGGFGSVLKGYDRVQEDRPCAVKIFHREVIDKVWLNHRFQQEVAALERIRNRAVVAIYGHGLTKEGEPYLVMEHIEGGTLRDLLNIGPVPAEWTGSLLLQAADALAEIHARGVYHRDLKPENLMIRRDSDRGEELVLIDFSIAIVKEPDQTMHGLSRAAGTIYYMAPEQAIGFARPASDIYSLAKILLEMLTGERLSVLLPDAAMDLPERVKELARELPVQFSEESLELIARALEFDPTRRPQNARAFAEPIGRDLLSGSRVF